MKRDRPPYELVERNLRHAMAFYSRSHPAGQVREMPGVAAISCGWNYPVFNSALLSSPVPGVDGDLSNRIAMASIYFRSLGIGWSYWACHDLLDASALRQLRDSCYSYGMDPVVTAPGMYAKTLISPQYPSAPLEVREVTDAASRIAFAHLVSTIFDLPFQMTMHIYGREQCWTPEYAGFIGYFEDRPVTISMVNVSDACCGFYSVGTVAGHRRRGYAETVMRTAHQTMQTRLPFDSCVLQSSTVGRRLYEQMGFREVTRFSVFRSASG
jgi:hypothetical protein